MRKSHPSILLLVATLGIAVPGCANHSSSESANGDPYKNLPSKDAEAMTASRNTFESSEDPPFNADTRFAAGQLAESQGHPEVAIDQYKAALKLDSKHEKSLYRLGILTSQAKLYPQAVDAWRQYIKLTNGNATAYSNLGFCLELSGKGSEAESAYKAGIKKEPMNEPCRVNYGLYLARTGRQKEAVDQLSAVLVPAEVHYNLASVYEQTGRRAEARAEYQKVLELDPEFWEAKARMAKLD